MNELRKRNPLFSDEELKIYYSLLVWFAFTKVMGTSRDRIRSLDRGRQDLGIRSIASPTKR